MPNKSELKVALATKARYVGRVLLRDKMPVWLILVGILIGSTVTYFVAPVLNSKFEVAKSRAAYITENLKGLNTDTANLFSVLTSASLELADGQGISQPTRKDLAKAIVLLQWRANEYEILFPDQDSLKTIRAYSTGIDAVRKTFLADARKPSSADIRDAAASLANSTRSLIALLSKKSEWSRTFSVI